MSPVLISDGADGSWSPAPRVAAGILPGLLGAVLGLALYAPLVLVAVRMLRRSADPSWA